MKALLWALIEQRRAARRTAFAIANLRLEAARADRAKDRGLARYLRSLADQIEAA